MLRPYTMKKYFYNEMEMHLRKNQLFAINESINNDFNISIINFYP